MPVNSKTLLLLGVAVITGLGVGGWLRTTETKRSMASVANPSKSALFKTQQLRMAKPNQMADVHVEVVGGFPNTNDQEATLRATVTLDRAFDGDVNFEWVLPPGVERVAGQLKDSVPGVLTGESFTREIVVLGFSSEGLPRNVTLEISGTSHGSIVGSSSVISSHPTRSDLSVGFRPNKQMVDENRLQQKAMGSDDEGEGEVRPSLPKGLKL